MADGPRLTLSKADIPSQGIPYPHIQVTVRTYSFGDILNFNESKLTGTDIIDFLARGIESNVPIDDLSYDDFMYISLLRKLSSMPGDQYKVKFNCKKCGHTNTDLFSVVGFDDLKVPDWPIYVDLDEEGTDFVEFGVFTVGDFKLLLSEGKTTDKVANLASCIKNKTQEEAYKILDDATGDLSEAFQEINVMLYHSVSDVELDCQECKNTNSIDLTDQKESLILPFRERQSAKTSRIRFGNKQGGGSGES